MSFQWMIQNAGTTTGAAAEGAFNSTQTPERKKLTKSKIQRRKGGGGGGGTYGVGAGIRKSKARRNASWNLIAMSAQRTQREAAAKAINVKISKIVGGAGSGFKSKKREALMAIMREGKQNVATRVTRKQNGECGCTRRQPCIVHIREAQLATLTSSHQASSSDSNSQNSCCMMDDADGSAGAGAGAAMHAAKADEMISSLFAGL